MSLSIDVSVWLRQSRNRAKKYKCFSDISQDDIHYLLKINNDNCGYCQNNKAATLDYLYSLRSGAPNVQANIMPVCQGCKMIKGQNNLTFLYNLQHLTEERFVDIIKQALSLKHGDIFKTFLKDTHGVDNG